ncbi:hypothetical protein HRED_06208, partial [Candidatus Haloredivivus sp. G17]
MTEETRDHVIPRTEEGHKARQVKDTTYRGDFNLEDSSVEDPTGNYEGLSRSLE